MKKFLLVFAVLSIYFSSAMAQSRHSSLVIKTTKEDVISVAVDGLPFSHADTQIAVRNLSKGKHYVRVVKVNNPLNPFKSKTEVVFEGYVKVKKKRELLAVVDSNRNLIIVKNEKAPKAAPYYDTMQKDRNNVNVNFNFGHVIPQLLGLLN
jgi:hypothetical protein